MSETDRIRTNDLKFKKEKGKFSDNKISKQNRGISVDNDHKAIDSISKLITQTTKNSESIQNSLKFSTRNKENNQIKSLSPDKYLNFDYLLPPLPANKAVKNL
jgi:hypothetical protein